MKLDKFIGMMTGHFDNKEQFDICLLYTSPSPRDA